MWLFAFAGPKTYSLRDVSGVPARDGRGTRRERWLEAPSVTEELFLSGRGSCCTYIDWMKLLVVGGIFLLFLILNLNYGF